MKFNQTPMYKIKSVETVSYFFRQENPICHEKFTQHQFQIALLVQDVPSKNMLLTLFRK